MFFSLTSVFWVSDVLVLILARHVVPLILLRTSSQLRVIMVIAYSNKDHTSDFPKNTKLRLLMSFICYAFHL